MVRALRWDAQVKYYLYDLIRVYKSTYLFYAILFFNSHYFSLVVVSDSLFVQSYTVTAKPLILQIFETATIVCTSSAFHFDK